MGSFEGMTEAAQAAFDKTLGSVLAAGGSVGLTLQWITGFGNVILIFLNVVLALGGIYLLVLRIRNAHRKSREWTKNETPKDSSSDSSEV